VPHAGEPDAAQTQVVVETDEISARPA